ncbi:hypothetical protein NDU88_003758 [Pleurodeles waltl]|uniref:Uncharacterized protein n=1 Tax=Pleurodeles waltl TaxID=8319 RepID=A0AAV7MST4_PLEWA|nr:hypothetical protein NDU88_003758 [Pleurodeles waltl]
MCGGRRGGGCFGLLAPAPLEDDDSSKGQWGREGFQLRFVCIYAFWNQVSRIPFHFYMQSYLDGHERP